MARLVLKEAKGPAEITVGDKKISICMCGLSTDPHGLCEGKHKKTTDEADGKVYTYDEELNREEIGSCDDEEGTCSCGGNCGCGHDHNH